MRGLLHPNYYPNPWQCININFWLDMQFDDLVAFQIVHDGWPCHSTDADCSVRIAGHGERYTISVNEAQLIRELFLCKVKRLLNFDDASEHGPDVQWEGD